MEEIGEIELARLLEQRAGCVQRATVCGERGPGGIAQRDIERLGIAVSFPGGDRVGKSLLGERHARTGFKLRPQGGAIKGGGVGIFPHRLTLHEQALAGMDAVEFAGELGDQPGLAFDAEQLSHKAIEVAAHGDHQFTLGLRIECGRLGAGGEQAVEQGGVIRLELCEEGAVEVDQPIARGQRGKARTETKMRVVGEAVHGHSLINLALVNRASAPLGAAALQHQSVAMPCRTHRSPAPPELGLNRDAGRPNMGYTF